MNRRLALFLSEHKLSAPEYLGIRLKFGYACSMRIRHLLEDPDVIACVDVLGRYLAGNATEVELAQAQENASRLANQHKGSKSIDGCGHAAVSASYAVSRSIRGDALDGASYSAYAMVYADGGYGAVAQPEAFEPEFSWQLATLKQLLAEESEAQAH